MEKEKIAIIIQARTSSTRLKQKVLKKFDNGHTLIEIVIDKIVKKFGNIYTIILATSDSKEDLILKKFAEESHIEFFQGNEINVLKRFEDACVAYNCTHFVRVCSDNPFLLVNFIDDLIFEHERNKNLDYIGFKLTNSVPAIKSHIGIFSEFGTLTALEKVKKLTNQSVYFENVTQFMYENPNSFDIKLIEAPQIIFNRITDIRLTLDDINDYEVLSKVYSKIKTFNPEVNDLVNLIDSEVEIKNQMIINIKKHIK